MLRCKRTVRTVPWTNLRFHYLHLSPVFSTPPCERTATYPSPLPAHDAKKNNNLCSNQRSKKEQTKAPLRGARMFFAELFKSPSERPCSRIISLLSGLFMDSRLTTFFSSDEGSTKNQSCEKKRRTLKYTLDRAGQGRKIIWGFTASLAMHISSNKRETKNVMLPTATFRGILFP